ncbi:DUF3331 domain-containing protein [Caballeronia novacaledonica]|uniref:DUF3331 domain-containing protein n=1 Tax=Caballeronia novacaledonica TaxID=1544861 RepID=UPI000D12E037|nr:DUF3331 domain-containing protein [Caballeronia novacaledonica]
MTCRIEDDIVRRALIALLPPEQHRPKSENHVHGLERTSRRKRRVANFGPVDEQRVPARIFVIEQPSSQTLSVCWSDSQSGHYAAQMWRKGVARKASLCVLSGAQILPGDAVYRPHAGERHSPANREYMLLASAVPEEASVVLQEQCEALAISRGE